VMGARIIKLTISLFVAASDWLRSRFGQLLGRPTRGTCVVLAFHSVTPEQRARFARHMDALSLLAKPIRADVKFPPDGGVRHVAITFDDGLQSAVDNALPELQQRGIPCTLFIVTEVLGGYPNWQSFESGNSSREKVMSEEQLCGLPSDLVAVGSHTMTHPALTAVDEERLEREISGSRKKLEKILNREVRLFSFPYGAFNERVVRRCREAGYERVFSALPVLAFSEPQEFLTGRVGAGATDWPIEFRLKLAGAYRWLPYAFTLKRRILSSFSGRALLKAGIRT